MVLWQLVERVDAGGYTGGACTVGVFSTRLSTAMPNQETSASKASPQALSSIIQNTTEVAKGMRDQILSLLERVQGPMPSPSPGLEPHAKEEASIGLIAEQRVLQAILSDIGYTLNELCGLID